MRPKIVQFKMNVSQSEKSLRDKISRLESELGRVKRWREEEKRTAERNGSTRNKSVCCDNKILDWNGISSSLNMVSKLNNFK